MKPHNAARIYEGIPQGNKVSRPTLDDWNMLYNIYD